MRRIRTAGWGAALLVAALGLPAGAQVPPTPSQIRQEIPFQAVNTVYTEDFEAGDGGFSVAGTASWQHGTPASPPVTQVGQGPGMWGTNLTGDYADNECGYIESPPIDLSLGAGANSPDPSVRITTARVGFRSWIHTERRWDGGIVMASSDGENWAPLQPFGGYPSDPFSPAQACIGLPDGQNFLSSLATSTPAADAWELLELDASAYLGGRLHLRFWFASDTSAVRRGWYVDDLIVQTGVGAAATVPLPQPPEEVEVPFTPAQTLYAEDFEASDGGWVEAGTGAWEWGAAVVPPEPLPGSLNAWGTRLNGNYLPQECSSLTSPPIDLPGADPDVSGTEAARVTMKMFQHFESGWDGAVVKISKDGGPFQVVTPVGGYNDDLIDSSPTNGCLGVVGTDFVFTGPFSTPDPDAWKDVAVDLTPFLGSKVQLQVVMGSDGDTERPGLYLDDVLVQVGAGVKAGAGACTQAPGWSTTGTNSSWCWGDPSTGPSTNRPVYATNPHGQFNASECSAIESPTIDTRAIPGLGTLTLNFEHWFNSSSTLDGGVVQVSTDGGGSWRTVTPLAGYGTNLGTDARNCTGSTQGFSSSKEPSTYEFREVRLSAQDGGSLKVRFVWGSSAFTHSDGWYIRDVRLSKGAGFVPLLP